MKEYGKCEPLAEAKQGSFTAQAFLAAGGKKIVLRIAPGTIMSEDQFHLWMPDFTPATMQVQTASVSMYEIDNQHNWDIEELKEYIQSSLNNMVSFLDGIETGAYFT